MTDMQKRIVVWAVIALGIVFAISKLSLGKLKPSSSPSVFGGGGASDFGGVTAPGVTPTPTGATQATTSATGDPVTQIGGAGLYKIPGTSYLGVLGAKAEDVKVGYYKTETSAGSAIVGANIPGLAGKTQGATPADITHLTAFHANDANVIAQVTKEKNQVAPGQTYKYIAGYRNDGSPILIY